MTIRSKTVEFAFPIHNASLATATRLDFASITLTLPETGTRTFLSVEVDVTSEGNTTGGTPLTARLIGITLGAATVSDQSISQTYANGGSSQCTFHHTRDVTSYFNTNFGGSSTQTCVVSLQYTGPATTNHCVKMIITYSYDDAPSGVSQDTRVKTVRIPLDSKAGNLTATLTEIGTNQVPVLNTLCPESTKTFLNVWFQVEGNNGALAGTDATMSFALDANAAFTTGLSEHQPATNNLVRYFFDATGLDTSVVHAFKLNVSSTNYAFPNASIVMYVTYTYSHTSSTRVVNSLMLSMSDLTGRPGIASGKPLILSAALNIAEPGTLTLLQSGVGFYHGDATMVGMSLKIGSATTRVHTYTSGQIGECGNTISSIRVDSGGSQGTGVTLAAGANTFSATCWAGTLADDDSFGTLTSGILYLNYSSDIATAGDGVHNHTTFWASRDACKAEPSPDFFTGTWTPTPPAPPELAYFMSDITFWMLMHPDCASLGCDALTYFELLSGETVRGNTGESWMTAFAMTPVYMFQGCSLWDVPVRLTGLFRQSPGLNTKPDLTVSREWRSNQTGPQIVPFGARMLITYHAFTFTFAGTVSGYTGSGSGITVDVYSVTTKALIGTTTTSAGGSYSLTVLSGDTYFAVAQQDSTHVGRSANAVGV